MDKQNLSRECIHSSENYRSIEIAHISGEQLQRLLNYYATEIWQGRKDAFCKYNLTIEIKALIGISTVNTSFIDIFEQLCFNT